MPPMVSVITISYNAETEIGNTIQSILCQNFIDYEYIFIDGNSKDRTVEVIASYRGKFESKGISYRVTSEPDKGIYDAMNKGIYQASGKWIIMLNAGDCLADEEVLCDIFSRPGLEGKILYGDTVLKNVRGNDVYYKISPASSAEKIEACLPFCHQSVFVPNELMKRYAFDARLRIAADYKFFVQAYQAGTPFVHIPRVISIYDCSGVSSTNYNKLGTEYDLIKKELFLDPKPNPKEWKKGRLSAGIKEIIKGIFPSIVYSSARGWHRDCRFYQNSKPD